MHELDTHISVVTSVVKSPKSKESWISMSQGYFHFGNIARESLDMG